MLFLSNADVKDLVDLDRAIEATARAYRDFAKGNIKPFPPQNFGIGNDAIRLSGGMITTDNGIGLRLSKAGYGGSIAILFSIDTGEVLSIMGFTHYGTMRTAALIGVACRRFATVEPAEVAMIGTGRNAPGYLRAVCRVRAVERVKVFSRNPESRKNFAASLQDELQIPVEPMETCDAAVEGARIIIVSTNAAEAVIESESLSTGAFVASMGRPRELGTSIYRAADKIIVPFRPTLSPADEEVELTQLEELALAGEIDWTSDVQELGSALDDSESNQSGDKQITVFREFQTGFGDVVLALEIYRECLTRGIGSELSL